MQALTQLKSRRDEIAAQIGKIDKELFELEEKLKPLKAELSSAVDKKQRTKETNRKMLNTETAKIENWKKIDGEIKR